MAASRLGQHQSVWALRGRSLPFAWMSALDGGFNGSTQHFNLFAKMECKSKPIVDGHFHG